MILDHISNLNLLAYYPNCIYVRGVSIGLIELFLYDHIAASSPVKKCRIDIASDYSTISASGSSSSAVHVASGNSNGQEIDEDLHSRQFAVNGRETTRRLFASNVLISGMHGLGAEIGNAFLFHFLMLLFGNY